MIFFDIETIPDYIIWERKEEKEFPPIYAHKIICISYLRCDKDFTKPIINTIFEKDKEDIIIGKFLDKIGDESYFITFNGSHFDIPLLVTRGMKYNISFPYFINKDFMYRYNIYPHFDICDWLSRFGATNKSSLDGLCKMFGLPGKNIIDGSKVEQFYNDGKYDTIKNYCKLDVFKIVYLYFVINNLYFGKDYCNIIEKIKKNIDIIDFTMQGGKK